MPTFFDFCRRWPKKCDNHLGPDRTTVPWSPQRFAEIEDIGERDAEACLEAAAIIAETETDLPSTRGDSVSREAAGSPQ